VRRYALTIGLVLAVALTLGAIGAFATGNGPVVAIDNEFEPAGSENGFIDAGEIGFFQNNGSNTHNVTAEAKGPDGKALFRTGNAPGGETRLIRGTQFLSQGIYPFVCTIHPGMEGAYQVFEDRGATTPLPRPEISLKVKSKKLGKVVDSGKLKVKVEAAEPTMAENIALKAKKGKKGITKAKKLNLAAGASKTVKLKLSKRGEAKLAVLDSAKVKVQGTVDFGFGDKASKKLK
jgi:plastocyanin